VQATANVNGDGGVIGIGIALAVKILGMPTPGLIDVIDDPGLAGAAVVVFPYAFAD
jgi:hypothetical protein